MVGLSPGANYVISKQKEACAPSTATVAAAATIAAAACYCCCCCCCCCRIKTWRRTRHAPPKRQRRPPIRGINPSRIAPTSFYDEIGHLQSRKRVTEHLRQETAGSSTPRQTAPTLKNSIMRGKRGPDEPKQTHLLCTTLEGNVKTVSV